MERERERERGSGERGRTGEVERVPVRRQRIGECRDSSDEKAAMLKQESQPMSERNNASVRESAAAGDRSKKDGGCRRRETELREAKGQKTKAEGRGAIGDSGRQEGRANRRTADGGEQTLDSRRQVGYGYAKGPTNTEGE
jgi:hypothetical protein